MGGKKQHTNNKPNNQQKIKFAVVISMPRVNDGVGYTPSMQQYYKQIGKVVKENQTINNETEKEEKWYKLEFRDGCSYTFWNHNIRFLPIIENTKTGCYACGSKIGFFSNGRRCVCGSIICTRCKKDKEIWNEGMCGNCKKLRDVAIKNKNKIIEEDSLAHQRAWIEITIKPKNYDTKIINLNEGDYDKVKKQYDKLMEQFDNTNTNIVRWNDGFSIKDEIKGLIIRKKG